MVRDMRSAATTPTEYLASVPLERRADIKALHALIRKTAPSLKPFMIAGMLGYGPYHYRYASGREGDWCWIGLASQKRYIALYICVVEEGRYLAEGFKTQFPKASIGKSCIRFKKLKDLDVKALKDLVAKTESWAKKKK